jgi:hypothetical protein
MGAKLGSSDIKISARIDGFQADGEYGKLCTLGKLG